MIETFKYIGTPEGRKKFTLILLISFFIASLMISSITASKLYIVSFFGFSVTIPVGTGLFAITFVCTDVISEVWGKRYAMLLVLSGFLTRIGALIFLTIAVNIPGAGAPIWDNQEAYSQILLSSSRIVLAGIVTYPISQTIDIIIYHYFMKKHQNENKLWIRNNLSTFGAQLLDSVVFIFIAFYNVLPNMVLVNIIIGQLIIKWIIALLDTPFVYIVRNIATSRKLFDFKG